MVLLLVETIQEGDDDDEDEEEDEDDGGGGCGGSVEATNDGGIGNSVFFGCHSIAAFDGIMTINLASL